MNRTRYNCAVVAAFATLIVAGGPRLRSASAQCSGVRLASAIETETIDEAQPPAILPTPPESVRSLSPAEPIEAASPVPPVQPRAACVPCRPIPEPPANPYSQLSYNNNFDWLDDPCGRPVDCFDELKRMPLGGGTTLDVGGEYRARFHNEHNLSLNGRNSDFLLHRTRLYGDLRTETGLRAYAEFIDAVSEGEEILPRPNEENRADFINLFVDAPLWDEAGQSMTARIGRQEMILGSQRLVSNRPFRNTTATFDGLRLMGTAGDWSTSAFLHRPVDDAQHPGHDHNFDNPDQSQTFSGLFASWRPKDGDEADLYFLRVDEDDPLVRGGNGVAGGFNANTFGARMQGSVSNLLWEAEGGYQFGDFASDRLLSGFYTLGLGYTFTDAPWTPTLWAFYDWASGDSDPTDSTRGTFQQPFPRGHYYLGWIDVTGRQNIEDLNFRLTFNPHKHVAFTLWYHIYHLEEARDALYSVADAGAGVRRFDPTGAAGTDVGEELDLIAQFDLHRHADLIVGYSHLYSGSFLARTGNGGDADFFYTQLSLPF